MKNVLLALNNGGFSHNHYETMKVKKNKAQCNQFFHHLPLVETMSRGQSIIFPYDTGSTMVIKEFSY